MGHQETFEFLRKAAFSHMSAEHMIEELTAKRLLWQKILIWNPNSWDNLEKGIKDKINGNYKNLLVITLESSNKNDSELYELVTSLNPQQLKMFPGVNCVYELYYFSSADQAPVHNSPEKKRSSLDFLSKYVPVKFKGGPMKSLKTFADYILNDYLEEYVTVYLSHVDKLNIPMKKLFSHLRPEQLRELTKADVVQLLEGFKDGTALKKAAEILRQWEKDNLPDVPKNAIHPSDLVLIYTAQKFTLYDFISMHANDLGSGMKIIRDLEEYYTAVQNNAVQMLFKMQQEAEMESSKRNRQLEEAQFLSHIGSWEWDILNDKIIWSNELYRIFGMQPQKKEITIETFKAFLLPHNTEKDMQRFKSAIQENKPFSFDYTIVRPDGALRTLQTRGESVFEKGVLSKVHGTTQDITEIKEAEIQKQLNRQKDEFISIASHELRVPISSIKAYIEQLSRSMSIETALKTGNCIEKACQHIDQLNGLILDLMDISKIQAGELQFDMEPFNFKEVLDENIKNNLLTGNCEIVFTGDANLLILGNKQRISQVLFNLVNNAVQYSMPGGKIIVQVTQEEEQLKFGITDYGIGISGEKRGEIFTHFYRSDHSGKQSSGLGLGLFLSAEIIKKHKGKIWVVSEDGKGTTFYFTVPLAIVFS